MPVTRRSATIAAAPAVVWQTVADPHQLRAGGRGSSASRASAAAASPRCCAPTAARWCARTSASASATSRGWSSGPRTSTARRSPSCCATRRPRVTLEPGGEDATRVELRLEQRLQGVSRFGGFLVKRAARKQLDGALAALAALYAAAPPSD